MQDTYQPHSPPQVNKEKSLIMASLPEEIIVEILSMLPVKSIVRFRCVCKNWCHKLFKHPKFVKLHLDHAIGNNKLFLLIPGYDHPAYSVNLCLSSAQNNESVVEIDLPFPLPLQKSYYGTYSACNGLILMHKPWEFPGVILWNPSTKEVKEIPKPEPDQRISTNVSFNDLDELDTGDNAVHSLLGFGYSSIIDDYKIVRAKISANAYGSYTSETEVYTLGSNSWKMIVNHVPVNDRFLGFSGGCTNAVSFKGFLHWIGHSIGREVIIISFDIQNNTFTEVPVNPELEKSLYIYGVWHSTCVPPFKSIIRDTFLGNFGGCLSLVQGGGLDLASNNDLDILIWVMKEYGVKESWTKMFTITKQSIEKSIPYSKMKVLNIAMNGVVLFLKDETSLVLYDPKSETDRVVNICGFSEDWSYVETYVESLTSLSSGTYLRL